MFGTIKGAFSGAENKKGLLELADGGTLFLDEINSMPIEVQSKLLRVVQDGAFRPLGGNHEKTVSIRYIAAMNEQPEVAIQKKELRSDLFYRLGVCMVVLPPLQQRLDDIPHLVEYFIRKHNPLLNTAITGYTPGLYPVAGVAPPLARKHPNARKCGTALHADVLAIK